MIYVMIYVTFIYVCKSLTFNPKFIPVFGANKLFCISVTFN